MLRVFGPLRQAAKLSTGITGLEGEVLGQASTPKLFAYWPTSTVHSNPIPALAETYRSTLSLVQKSLPTTSSYRKSVEALTQQRLAIVEAAEPANAIDKVEKEIDQGQIEEVIIAAKNELNLVAQMIEWKS